jgi:hypothetical protein
MSIEQLLGHTTEQLEAMSTEELLVKFASVFDLEKKLIAEGELQVIKDPTPDEEEGDTTEGDAKLITVKTKAPKKSKTPKEKALEQLEKIKNSLMELEKESK